MDLIVNTETGATKESNNHVQRITLKVNLESTHAEMDFLNPLEMEELQKPLDETFPQTQT